MHVRSLGFHRHPQRILLLVISERAPRRRVLRKNDRPLVGVRNHVQPVRPLVERLAFDRDRIAERNRRIQIRSRPPHLAIGNQTAPHLALVHQRTVIVDRDICNPDALRNLRPLALQRQVEQHRLRQAGDRQSPRHGCQQQAKQESTRNSKHTESLLQCALTTCAERKSL